MKNRMDRFRFPPDGDVRADLVAKYPDLGDLVDFYVGNTGPIIHKWHHYLPIYDRYFGPWRGRKLRFLEIGVFKGGSLALWRKYFGPDATIFGIDINPDCAAQDGINGQVRIGSQADAEFLGRVIAEMGGVDVILDDGSHRMEHVRASLDILFPQLAPGGTYMIEDLHTSYWANFGGGMKEPANFFNLLRGLADDMHHWYHPGPARHPATAGQVSGVHLHDSIVVIEKGAVHPPVHSQVGGRKRPAKGEG